MKHLLCGALLLLFAVPSTVLGGSGGPDFFGYTWKDSNDASAGAPVYEWIPPTLGNPIVPAGGHPVGQMDIGAEEHNGRLEDSDGDGMPDYWENLYGFDTSDAMDAAEDADGDSLSNLREFQSGRLSLDIEFTSQPGVIYWLEASSNLETWKPIVTVTEAQGTATTGPCSVPLQPRVGPSAAAWCRVPTPASSGAHPQRQPA